MVARRQEDEAPSLSVVVCAFTIDRWNELLAAVNSVRAQSPPVQQIVVVIDHCPALEGRIRRHAATAWASGVRPDIVANRYQQGLSGARNSGVDVSDGDVVAFLDDDATAAPGWAAALVPNYQSRDVLGVGGRIEPAWAVERPRWWPAEFDWVAGCSYLGWPEHRGPVRNMIGANMSFRRHVFAEVGGFLSALGRVANIPSGCEETELCIRIRKRWPGHQIVYEPAAVVYHLVPPQRATVEYYRRRCYAEGLSKAFVARIAGSRDGLASERHYATRTLPSGAIRHLAAALSSSSAGGVDTGGFARAAAIAFGLACTTAGYVRGRLANLGASHAVEGTRMVDETGGPNLSVS
jgi:glycosyltransferase involved in cell wall biosynthesis